MESTIDKKFIVEEKWRMNFSVMIRNATINDLLIIEQVHQKCFPDSFSTKLGDNNHLLSNLYREYMEDIPELFIVYTDVKGKIVGFTMGYYCEKNDYQRLFLKHNFWKILLKMIQLLFCGNKKAWHKVVSLLKEEKRSVINNDIDKIEVNKRGDLLSICVLPEFRGKGAARELITEFQNELAKRNREICLLTVENNNSRAIHFYKNCGYEPYRTIGKRETTYYLRLREK